MTVSDALIDYARRLPKAELHLHIEGSLEPKLMFELAQRNGVTLPYKSVEDIRAAYSFTDLQSFLDIYYQGMSVLQTEQDFYDLTDAYLARAAEDNIKHVEIFFDPQGHTERGLPFPIPIEGTLRALKDGETKYGISSGLIMCFLRHLSEEAAFDTLAEADPWIDQLLGVGLDSSELGHPPSKFERVFAAAREKGLKLVAHAGEEGPPEYVSEALDLLKIDRLDHGNRSLEDDALIERLRDAQMTYTVCPLSNIKLCNCDRIENHPIKRMLDLGLKATINSDDPSYFGGYLMDNFKAVIEALPMTRDDITTLARNSFEGSFLSDDQKAAHIAAIRAED